MNLTINGESRADLAIAHLAELVARLGLDARKVAVEHNLEIVPRSAYAATRLSDGDRIEIVHFIGGG
ncbi:sulfur carrier protein ThiS [Phenylobacterium sp.]|uniref:sulfur carrier protein ThiS n=1 Tax=Phenylobacterium sp. TaxID=1871053 RepID=UPI002734D5CE|nr:sulfur carrier protein ThiS [Phenylobacterium sp.]MDP3659926.1 sulfur carrier protein ThiS [Phenylobacterium sp.]